MNARSPGCDDDKRTDLAGEHVDYEEAGGLHWRTGTQVGRTIYAVQTDGWERLIGMMDTPELAANVVAAHNAQVAGRDVR